jgi:imidazolonepropionase
MSILIRGAKQLLTMHGAPGPRRGPELSELGMIADGAVLIENGKIKEAGPTRRLENLHAARGAMQIDAAGRVVMPGFVDSHTHLIFCPSLLEDYEAGISGAADQSFFEMPDPTSSFRSIARSSANRLESRASRTIATFARHGTTTLEVKTGFGGDRTGEIKTLRVLRRLGGHPLDVIPTCLAAPSNGSGGPGRYLEWWSGELLPMIFQRKLATFADIMFDWAPVGLDEARHSLEAARRLGLRLKVHCGARDAADHIRMAVDLGAVSVDHVERAADPAAAIPARSGTIATLLPASAFYSRTCCSSVRELISRGTAIALASDFGLRASLTCNMQMVLSLACSQLRMTPAEAITAATINGAHALAQGDRIGSLEPGKQADVIVLNVSDYREIPYQFGCNHVHLAIKQGKIIYREGAVNGKEGGGGEPPDGLNPKS